MSLNINPAHEYELALYGWVGAWDAKFALISMNVDIVGVPEAETIILLALGLGFLFLSMKILFREHILR